MRNIKNRIFLVLFSIFTANVYAQSAEQTLSTELDNLFKVELGLQGIGLGYELAISNKWSVDLSTGLGTGYNITNSEGSSTFTSHFILNQPVVYFKSGFRYHYNRNKRLSKAKQIRNNAGNYLAFQTKYATRKVFNENASDQINTPLNRTLLNEIHWGIQRAVGQKFLFNLHLGVGYARDFDFGNGALYPALGLKFSYIIRRASPTR